MLSTSEQFIAKLLSHYFSEKSSLNIFDFGCGNGGLFKLLNPSRVASYRGIDISADAISVAKQNHPQKKFKFEVTRPDHIDASLPPATQDLSIAIGVLQYLSPNQIDEYIQFSETILRPGGLFVVSCAVDHLPYRLANIYRLFLPHSYVSKKTLLTNLKQHGFEISLAQEKGLVVAPLFSNVLSLFFDSFDRIFLNTRGKIGPVGSFARSAIKPLIQLEYLLPINYGHTLFVVAKKR